jgi:hypothetical protein
MVCRACAYIARIPRDCKRRGVAPRYPTPVDEAAWRVL